MTPHVYASGSSTAHATSLQQDNSSSHSPPWPLTNSTQNTMTSPPLLPPAIPHFSRYPTAPYGSYPTAISNYYNTGFPLSNQHHAHHSMSATMMNAINNDPTHTVGLNAATGTMQKPKLTTTVWEDEGTLCYQVDAKSVCVARRQDNDMINGTKLLNVVGMSRGKRDGILKNEKGRVVVKVGAMHLKGVWITFNRAKDLATKFKIVDILYPLFVEDPSIFLTVQQQQHPIIAATTTTSSNPANANPTSHMGNGHHDMQPPALPSIYHQQLSPVPSSNSNSMLTNTTTTTDNDNNEYYCYRSPPASSSYYYNKAPYYQPPVYTASDSYYDRKLPYLNCTAEEQQQQQQQMERKMIDLPSSPPPEMNASYYSTATTSAPTKHSPLGSPLVNNRKRLTTTEPSGLEHQDDDALLMNNSRGRKRAYHHTNNTNGTTSTISHNNSIKKRAKVLNTTL